MDFTEARDSEWQWHQLAICQSAPCSRQIKMPAPHRSVLYRPDALPAAQPTASKHCRLKHRHMYVQSERYVDGTGIYVQSERYGDGTGKYVQSEGYGDGTGKYVQSEGYGDGTGTLRTLRSISFLI